MKPHALLFLLTCMAFTCCNDGPPDQTTTLPVKLGTPRDSALLLLGLPDRENVRDDGDTTQSFFKHGYWLKYHGGRVHAISVCEFVEGEKFSGKILGLNLESELSDCEERWGQYASEEDQGAHTLYTWYVNGNTIEAEVFNESGGWATSDGGYTKGKLRSLTVTRGVPK